MAKKRHGGLGRGLDALIPRAPREESREQKTQEQDNKEQEVREEKPEEAVSEISGAVSSSDLHGAEQTGELSGTEKSSGLSEKEPAAETNGFSVEEMSSASPGKEQETDFPETGNSVHSSTGGKTDPPSGGIQMLRLSQVDPNRSQPRMNFPDEALEELADSIRQFGVLQPILVQKKGSRYEIIAGERRWRASRKAGLKEIPAIVKEYSDQETVELSLIENIQREDLNPIEEAKAFKRLLDEFGLRQEDLAARVSKSRTAVANAVRLLKLDERVQEMIIQEEISMGHARALLPLEIPEEQFLLAQQAAEKHLSVREVEKLIKNRLAGGKKGTGKLSGGKKESETDPALELAYRAIEERLKQSLGTKASIRHGSGGTGKLEIEFYSHEDLEKIVDLLT